MKRLIKIILPLLLLFWCFGFTAEFYIPLFNKLIYALPFLKKAYSLVCHQQHEKVIMYGIYETYVCSRCAGIYLGAFISSIINLFISKEVKLSTKVFILSSVPMFIDVIAVILNIYYYSKENAFFTGLLFGMVSFFYFYNALNNLLYELKEEKK